MFPEFSLHDWLQDIKANTQYDLTNSGLARYDYHNYPGVIPPLLRDLPEPTQETTVEAELATEYDIDKTNIVVTCRCQHANFIAVATARDIAETTNGSLLVESPTYNPLFKTPRGLGLQVNTFHRSKENEFKIDPNALRDALTPDTVGIMITNRHNPTGQVTDRATLAKLADIAEANDAYLIVDEVYAPFFLNPPSSSPTPFGGITAAGLPNTVVTNSMTKFFGLYDISLGWIIADKRFANKANAIERHTNAVAKPSRELAKHAFANKSALIEQSREMLETRTSKLQSFLNATPSLTGTAVSPGVLAFVRHNTLNGSEFVENARNNGIALQPGRFFSPANDYEDYFRIAVGRADPHLSTGLDALQSLSADLAE